MIYQISVPAVAEDVEEVRVLEWHGAPGTAFETGDLIVEFETHKAVVEVRAGQPGLLRGILARAGDWAKVGSPIALFADTTDERLPKTAQDLVELTVEFLVD